MATTTTTTNKPLNPRAQDLSPKGYNRAALFSGKALDFDGVNDLVTGSSAALPSSDYTIAAWFNVDTLKASGLVIWGDETASERRGMVLWDGGVGNWRLFSSTFALNIPSTTTIQAGRWYFGVVTLTAAGAATIYINGKQDGTGTNTLAAYTGTQYKIGDSGSSEFTDGKIAGVRVFNQVLTAAQVADLYLNPEKITPDGVATSALKLWLPMMEGAGASAYDGSGNGNDGTINGATWTAGVGAPVAQTALVSWNKGINGAIRSENFGSGDWIKNATAVTDNTIAAPNGTTTADTLSNNTTNATHRFYQLVQAFTGTGALSFSIYLKYKDHRYFSFGLTDDIQYRSQIVVDLLNGTITDNFVDGSTTITSSTLTAVGDGWYKLSATINATGAWGGNIYALGVMLNQSTFTSAGYVGTGTGVYIWGAQANIGTAQPYIKTNATAQTSAVLVPEGLTAGASIFGTDIITPRNAFALNLDGASWAKIGRNSSVSPTTAITLEAWLNKSDKTGYHHIISRNSVSLYYYAMFTDITTGYLSFQGSNGSPYVTSDVDVSTGSWVHCLVTYNTTSALFYVNGTLVATKSITTGLVPNDVDVFIGARPNGIQLFDGDIANPRIYNRALTAAEVLRNYNADKAKFGL